MDLLLFIIDNCGWVALLGVCGHDLGGVEFFYVGLGLGDVVEDAVVVVARAVVLLLLLLLLHLF